MLETELAQSYLTENLLFILAIKRWDAGEENKEHDAARPNVTLICVALIEYLWSHIVCSTNHLIAKFTWF